MHLQLFLRQINVNLNWVSVRVEVFLLQRRRTVGVTTRYYDGQGAVTKPGFGFVGVGIIRKLYDPTRMPITTCNDVGNTVDTEAVVTLLYS